MPAGRGADHTARLVKKRETGSLLYTIGPATKEYYEGSSE